MKEFQTFDEMGPLTKATLIGRRFAKRCHIFFASHPWARRVSVVLAMALVVWVNWVPSPNRTASRKLDARYAQLPLSFEVNQGQSDAQVKFLQRGGGHAVYLTERGEPVLIFKGRQHGNGRAKAPGLPFRVAQEERTLLALAVVLQDEVRIAHPISGQAVGIGDLADEDARIGRIGPVAVAAAEDREHEGPAPGRQERAARERLARGAAAREPGRDAHDRAAPEGEREPAAVRRPHGMVEDMRAGLPWSASTAATALSRSSTALSGQSMVVSHGWFMQ